jgi:hypothetical protein
MSSIRRVRRSFTLPLDLDAWVQAQMQNGASLSAVIERCIALAQAAEAQPEPPAMALLRRTHEGIEVLRDIEGFKATLTYNDDATVPGSYDQWLDGFDQWRKHNG